MTLYHYTCDHGFNAIGRTGVIVPARLLTSNDLADWLPAQFAWMTDMAYPDREALGLTSQVLKCDRTAHRYRVTDEENVVSWVTARKAFRHAASVIENVPGVRVRHWYVSLEAVPVALDER